MILNTKPRISLIAAIGKNRELGRGNDLIFKIPEDMKHFRDVTNGHPIIMGRKTYESIGKILPNRLNIVITRDTKEFEKRHPEFISGSQDSGSLQRRAGGIGMTKGVVVSSLDEAIEKAKETENNEIFVIGGGQIFDQAIKMANKLYLTVVDSESPDADVSFPDYSDFKNVISERKSSNSNYKYSFIELKK